MRKNTCLLSSTLAHSPTNSSLCWTYLQNNRKDFQTHNSTKITLLLQLSLLTYFTKTPTGHNHQFLKNKVLIWKVSLSPSFPPSFFPQFFYSLHNQRSLQVKWGKKRTMEPNFPFPLRYQGENRLIGLVGRVFVNGLGDWCSIPGQVIPKT